MKPNTIDKTNRSIFSDGAPLQAHAGVTGVVKVHESVITSIVRKAACSVPGVIRLAGNTLVDNIAEFVGSKKVYDRSIAIDMGDNAVSIELKVIMEFGVYIPDVAEALQNTITDEIVKITGMQVPQIDVVVVDLEDPEPETSEEDEEDGEEENEPEQDNR